MSTQSNRPAIGIHGGAGAVLPFLSDPDINQAHHDALQNALNSGFNLLSTGASALEAVRKAVCTLEDCELFNAGRGSVFNARGKHAMDAAIMDGQSRQAGAVAGIKGVKNPILLADHVREDDQYVFLAGDEAIEYARHKNVPFGPESYFFSQLRYDQWQEVKGTDRVRLDHAPGDTKYGTVGAVAVDENGHLAAATSTGGTTNKAWGRIGDSPIIGAGTYANNNTAAVSCTGHGELFLRGVAAYDLSCLIEYKGLKIKQAADQVIHHHIKDLQGAGGLIAIDATGSIAMPFSTEAMFRGTQDAHGIRTKIR